MTWEPEPGWVSVPSGTGTSTVGVWRTERGGQPLAVKRLARPLPGEPPELDDPTHFAYWRREADVAESSLNRTTPGLIGPVTAVEEDDTGITLVSEWVEDAGINGLFVAHALGRFAAADLGNRSWLSRDLLRRRVARVERRGGWPTLARTSAADLADSLWTRREHFLQRYDALPQVPTTATSPPETCAAATAAWSWPSTGRRWAWAGRHRSGATHGQRARGARTPPRRLPARPGRVGRGTSPLPTRCGSAPASSRRTPPSPGRVGPGQGRRGSGRAGGQVPPPSVAPYLRALERVTPQV